MKREAVIVSMARSAVGKYRGGFAPLPPDELSAAVLKEAVKRAGVDPAKIDEVFWGNLTALQYNNMARVAALKAGLPVHVPATTLDKQCGTSVTGAAIAAMFIENGVYDRVVVGGVNSDTRRLWLYEKTKAPYDMAYPKPVPYPITSPKEFEEPNMLATAENVAREYGITRAECDEYAAKSHQKAHAAQKNGAFAGAIVPVTVDLGKGKSVTIDSDESIRPGSSAESLGKLPVVSGYADGIVTAGNSSPFSDAASAMVVMERGAAAAEGLPILATIRGYQTVGVEPRIMGIGPVPAVRQLLHRTGLSMNDISLFELNEAFASQVLAVQRELGIPEERLNIDGGAIALGHPLAATGVILLSKLVTCLKRLGKRYGIVTMCCGGGQGVAMLVENENGT